MNITKIAASALLACSMLVAAGCHDDHDPNTGRVVGPDAGQNDRGSHYNPMVNSTGSGAGVSNTGGQSLNGNSNPEGKTVIGGNGAAR